jgi:hypothetical protein
VYARTRTEREVLVSGLIGAFASWKSSSQICVEARCVSCIRVSSSHTMAILAILIADAGCLPSGICRSDLERTPRQGKWGRCSLVAHDMLTWCECMSWRSPSEVARPASLHKRTSIRAYRFRCQSAVQLIVVPDPHVHALSSMPQTHAHALALHAMRWPTCWI